MSTRDLRVRFIGDAGNLKSSFAEANAAAAGLGSGLSRADVNANAVGKSFTRTGKIFKSTGKILKSSGLDALSAGSSFAAVVPALSGVSSGLGAVTVGADALITTAGSLGAVALPAMGVAAIAAAGAYAFLHDDVSSATDALRAMESEEGRVRSAHRETARAALFQKQAVEGLEDAQLAQRQSSLGLWQAQHDLAEVAKANGKNSLEYRMALLQVKQAEDAVSDARRATINQAQEVIRLTERRSKATDKETAAVRKQRAEADKVALGLRLGLIAGKDREAAAKKVAAAIEAEGKAANRAQSRHQSNAKAARAAAAAMKGDASPAAQELRAKLLELAGTEMDLSQVIAAMNDLAAAAGSAAAGVLAAAAAVNAMPTTVQAPRVVGGGGGGGKKAPIVGRTIFGMKEDGRGRSGVSPLRGELSSLGFDTVAGLIIGTRHRDDSLQDKVAASRARAAAKKAGVTNPDKVSAMEDKRVAELRLKEVKADVGTVKRQRIKLRTRVVALRKRLADQRAARRKAKKDDQPKLDSAIEDTRNRIRGLWDQDRAMGRDLAELQAEAKELGYDINALDQGIGGMPNAVPEDEEEPEMPPTLMEYSEAEVAMAALTKDPNDDVTAAESLVRAAQGEYDVALAGGDPRKISAAANALASARAALQNAKDLRDNTDALNANTDALTGAFGGSSVFSFRGQDFVLRSLAPPSSDDLRMGAI